MPPMQPVAGSITPLTSATLCGTSASKPLAARPSNAVPKVIMVNGLWQSLQLFSITGEAGWCLCHQLLSIGQPGVCAGVPIFDVAL